MIRSSANLSADDVTVRCRVRRSIYASNPKFEEAQEMTCTMRSWQALDSSWQALDASHHTATAHEGPELVLRRVPTSPLHNDGQFSERFQSFGSSGSLKRAAAEAGEVGYQPPTQPRSIPVGDVVVVDAHPSSSLLFVTTISHGYLEFSFADGNAHDCLLAFLSSSLPMERIVTHEVEQRGRSSCSSADSCSFDLDAFTANRMEERVRSESFGEKMQRKIARFAMCFEEMSTALAECAPCGVDAGADGSPTKASWQQDRTDDDDARRDSPPKPEMLEYSESHMDSFSQFDCSVVTTSSKPNTISSSSKPPPHRARGGVAPEMQLV